MSVNAAEVEFDVDPHGAESTAPEEVAEVKDEQEEATAAVIAMGWTPEEATALVCALWNLGILLYGPEWAANPAETIGWNISLAQLLDTYVPKDAGGYVATGAGLLMIGNGVMMMAARRTEIIRRGPRPLWVRRPEQADQAPAAATPTPPPAPQSPSNGHYTLPTELRPKSGDPTSIGLEL